jgi:hypothetical protein
LQWEPKLKEQRMRLRYGGGKNRQKSHRHLEGIDSGATTERDFLSLYE